VLSAHPQLKNQLMFKYNEKKQEGQEFVIFNLLKSNKKLKALDVLLYQQIVYTSAFTGYSPKTNKYFIEFFNDTEWNIRKSIELLIEEGLITRTLTSNTDRKLYPVKLDFSKDLPMSETQGSVSVPQGGVSVPQGLASVPQGGVSVPHTYNNIKIQLDNIKNKNNNNINITENSDFVEELDGVANITSKKYHSVGVDNIIPGNDDGIELPLKEEIEIPIEEKVKSFSIKEKQIEEIEIFDEGFKDISSKFNEYEQLNALNY